MTSGVVRLAITHEPDVTHALLEANVTVSGLGFSAVDRQMVATATSELARNILKYAGKGEITLQTIERHGRVGVEIKAIDRGPGIADVEQALADHYSTSGTLGLGLPGVKRMMDEFDVQSTVGQGTTVTFRKWRS